MDKYDIIKKPIRTEKSELLRGSLNKYTFEVAREANKVQIRKAVEEIFKVEVKSVTTLVVKPKKKRHKMSSYLTPIIKKAVVELKSGNTIKYFEGV